MTFPAYASIKLTDPLLTKLQDSVAKSLKPLLGHPLLDGRLVTNQTIAAAGSKVEHGLGRAYQGWWLVSPKGNAVVWEDSASMADRTKFLPLVASADVTASVWVY